MLNAYNFYICDMTTEEKINELRKELRQHNYNYYILDDPTISDFDFDIKLKELQMLLCEEIMKT